MQRRLNKLEKLATPYKSSPLAAFPAYPLDDQADDVLDACYSTGAWGRIGAVTP
jgi:hypothetical protein